MRPSLSPRTDVVFRRLFSGDGLPLLQGLLNALLDWDRPITQLVEQPANLLGDGADEMEVVLDVVAIDDTGRRYDVEMQMWGQPHYPERSLFYWARLHASQLPRGSAYGTLHPSIGVHLLSWPFRPGGGWCHDFMVRTEAGEPLTNHLRLLIVDLTEARTVAPGSVTGSWFQFLLRGEELTPEQARGLGGDIPDAVERLRMISQDEILRIAAIRRERAERDAYSLIEDTRTIARAEGVAEGLAVGRADGRRDALLAVAAHVLDPTELDELRSVRDLDVLEHRFHELLGARLAR